MGCTDSNLLQGKPIAYNPYNNPYPSSQPRSQQYLQNYPLSGNSPNSSREGGSNSTTNEPIASNPPPSMLNSMYEYERVC